jgi:hypothetical protein
MTDKTGTAVLLLLFPAIGYYALLLTALGSAGFFAPVTYGLNFNSMLLHLLRGRFDVDPAAIGYEGFLRDGAVYSYFGIFPALLRAPLLALRDFAATDFTRVSCLVGAALMGLLKGLSALVVRRAAAAQRPLLLALFVVTLFFSGPQVQFLRPSIYQEILLWADVFAAAFVLLVLLGWSRPEGFTNRLLTTLAALAGLCLLTRVSTGLGLYFALGLLWSWRAWQAERRPEGGPAGSGRLARCQPLLVLALFAVAVGYVNQQRWGDPFVFVDLARGLMIGAPEFHYPTALADYGEFSPWRLPYGLIYYFFPVWVLRDGTGQLLWSGFTQRAMIDIELPPSSFILSDPLLVAFALYGVWRLARGSVPRRAPIVLAGLGLAVPGVLMLTAAAMAFRYRMEFYPFFELCGLIGFGCLPAAPGRRTELAIGGAALASVVAAAFLWLLSMLSPFGTAAQRLGPTGVVTFYECMLRHCSPAVPGDGTPP